LLDAGYWILDAGCWLLDADAAGAPVLMDAIGLKFLGTSFNYIPYRNQNITPYKSSIQYPASSINKDIP
jgi:hypothetical protein